MIQGGHGLGAGAGGVCVGGGVRSSPAEGERMPARSGFRGVAAWLGAGRCRQGKEGSLEGRPTGASPVAMRSRGCGRSRRLHGGPLLRLDGRQVPKAKLLPWPVPRAQPCSMAPQGLLLP